MNGMRVRSGIPAIQLRSTASRYCRMRQADVISSRYRHTGQRLTGPTQQQNESWMTTASPDHRTDRMARLEAVLFLSRESLNSRKLSEYADLEDGTEARTLVRQLNHVYQQEQSVLRVERVAGGYQLVTHWQFGRWLKRLGADQPELRLSSPSMETLAVVAYRQPVLRAEIEAIRGVSCGEMLRQLMERDLVRIRGRSEELGRPYLYGTTKRFLQRFGLDNIDELLESDIVMSSTGNIKETTMEMVATDDSENKPDDLLPQDDEIDPEDEWDSEEEDYDDEDEAYEDDDEEYETYDDDESDEEYLEEDEEELEEDDWEEVDDDEEGEDEEGEDEDSWEEEESWEEDEEDSEDWDEDEYQE